VTSTTTPSRTRFSPRLPTPHETAVIRRVLEVGAKQPLTPEWVHSVANWVVVADCTCGCDALYFHVDPSTCGMAFGKVIAHAIGINHVNGRYIEILLWAREGVATFMELERLSRGTPRLPLVESIRRAPKNLHNRTWN
jgi:hypothetical protein